MEEKYLINESKEIVLEIGSAKIKLAVSIENLPIEGRNLAEKKLTAMFRTLVKTQ